MWMTKKREEDNTTTIFIVAVRLDAWADQVEIVPVIVYARSVSLNALLAMRSDGGSRQISYSDPVDRTGPSLGQQHSSPKHSSTLFIVVFAHLSPISPFPI